MTQQTLPEALTSMSDLADILPRVQEALTHLQGGRISVVPYLDEVGIGFELDGVPVVVYYSLRSHDQAQFRRQLASALRSHRGGRAAGWREDVTQAISGETLRPHALGYLMNSDRWRQVDISYDGQRLPVHV